MARSRCRVWRRVVLGCLMVGLSVGAVLPAAAIPVRSMGALAADGSQKVVPISWGGCPAGALDQVPVPQRSLFSCASYAVPMDYTHPSQGVVTLALMRRAAGRPHQRIGSLFVNPGGPDESGFDWTPQVGSRLQQPVLDRFDIIGFDPRGVGRSSPLRCFAREEDKKAVLSKITAVPLSSQEISTTLDAFREYGQTCARNAGPLLEHMAIADVARDMDLLRAAVGDEKLTYIGLSYGTLLGATYANLFPHRVRALVLDGNLDPVLSTSNGWELVRQSGQGAEQSLAAFLIRCRAAGNKCAFSAGDPKAKFDGVRDHLRHGPLALPDGSSVTISTFTNQVYFTLYQASQLRLLAERLQTLYEAIHPAHATPPQTELANLHVFTQLPSLPSPHANPAQKDTPETSDDSNSAIVCTDIPFPRTPAVLPHVAETWEHESPTFGRFQVFWSGPAGCTTWPNFPADAYRGPWNHPTTTPVLVVGNVHDPVTPYTFSQQMARELGNATLLTADAFGHAILGRSTCADTITTDYLTNLTPPPPHKVCQPNTQPF